jgi:hypothetical protein
MEANLRSSPVPKAAERADLRTGSGSGLQAFAKNVWIVDGPDVLAMGILFTTRMMIVRLSDGSVWVNSPVPASFETLTSITGLGPVKYLVAATPRHVWRLDAWHTLFPEAQLWTARPSPFTLEKGDLPFDGTLEDGPQKGWAEDLDQLAFKGNPLLEEVIFFHRESGTVILDDLIQTHRPRPGRSLHNALIKIFGAAYPHRGVGRDIKLSFTNRGLARRSLERLLAWNFDRLIIAHGDCIEKDAKAVVAEAFRWLAR